MQRIKPCQMDCSRGAPMGRRNILPDNTNEPIKLQLRKLPLVDGDYDQGGAYWGNTPGTDIYYAKGDASDVVVEVFTRAASRDEAKTEIRKLLPNARFYR